MTALTPSTLYTSEAYLALEVESEIRHEYRNGEIMPMRGGTPEHNKITSALNALLWFALRGRPYSLFITDQRLWIPAVDLYTYPDVMVIANPIELKPGRKDTVTNPILLVEVLSDSTAAYDRGDKFAAYRTIPSVQEYVLVAQDRPYIEQYVKQAPHQWLFTDHSAREAALRLATVGVELSLADIYEGSLPA